MKVIIGFLACLTIIAGQERFNGQGHVKAESGEALAYVNVYFLDNLEGAMTNEEGQFAIPTRTAGRRTLRISTLASSSRRLLSM